MRNKIEILKGDICEIEVNAIICQANTELELEDEITELLFRRGGEKTQAACNQLEQLQKGEAVLTDGGKLGADYLMYALMYNMGEHVEEEDMMVALRAALKLANEKNLSSIAIPMIGESVGIPIKRAAELMLAEVKKHLEGETSIEKVKFVLQDPDHYEALDEGFRQL